MRGLYGPDTTTAAGDIPRRRVLETVAERAERAMRRYRHDAVELAIRGDRDGARAMVRRFRHARERLRYARDLLA